MLEKQQKTEIITNLIKAVYSMYIQNMVVRDFYLEKYPEEVKVKYGESIRIELAKLRIDSKNYQMDVKNTDEEKKEELVKTGNKINELSGKIDFATEIEKKYREVCDSLAENISQWLMFEKIIKQLPNVK